MQGKFPDSAMSHSNAAERARGGRRSCDIGLGLLVYYGRSLAPLVRLAGSPDIRG